MEERVDQNPIVLRKRFLAPPWRQALFLLLLAAAGIAAGIWQSKRALYKEEVTAMLLARTRQPLLHGPDFGDLAEHEFRLIQLHGEFVASWPLWLENRPHDGRPGFVLVMPFRLEGTDQHVLVARGWAPRDPQQRDRLPPLFTPAGSWALDGMIRRDFDHVMQLGTPPAPAPGAILQNLDHAALAKASGLKLLPWVLEQRSSLDDKLLRQWPQVGSGADKHRAYAFQWFGLSAAAIGFYLYLGVRRARET